MSLSSWTYVALFIALFLDALLFVGIAIPTTLLLLSVGFAVSLDKLSPTAALVALILGAITGNQSSYGFGRFLGERIKQKRLSKHAARLAPRLMTKCWPLLLTYHFVYALRMVVPFVAGEQRIPFAKWLLLDSIGIVIWICSTTAAGAVLGIRPGLQSLTWAGIVAVAASGIPLLIYSVTVWRGLKRTSQPSD